MRVAFEDVSDVSLTEANDLIKLLLTAKVAEMNQVSVDEWRRVVSDLAERLKAGVTDVDFLAMFEVAVEKEMLKRGISPNRITAQAH